jgi:hypothetical protein
VRDEDWWESRVVRVRECSIASRRPDGVYFSCLSPQDEAHDIGKSAYKIKEVLKVLKNRYCYLMDKNFGPGESLLRVLINPWNQPFTYLKQEEL